MAVPAIPMLAPMRRIVLVGLAALLCNGDLRGQVIVTNPVPVVVTITSPTSSNTYDAVDATSVALAGSASSGHSVTSCTWVNSRGGSGLSTSTSSAQPLAWTIAAVLLYTGENVITVRCFDTANVYAGDEIVVTTTGGISGSYFFPSSYRHPLNQ